MSKRRRIAVIVSLLAVLAWWLLPDPAPERAALRSARPASATPAPPPSAAAQPIAAAEPSAAPEPVDEARLAAFYDRVAEDGRRVRCAVNEVLGDGAYTTLGDVAWVQVQRGVLTATVPEADGEAPLPSQLQPVAVLRWSAAEPGQWGSCELRPLQSVEVRGRLTHADGAPAVDFAVRGCVHGEFARTDDQGRWVSEAIDGQTCHPMAFVVTDDGRFGRSEPVAVAVVAPGPVGGVELVLPTVDALWSVDEQRAMAAQLAALVEARASGPRERLDQARRLLDQEGDEGLLAFVQRFVDDDQLLLDRVNAQIERLDDVDESVTALQEAWMNLY